MSAETLQTLSVISYAVAGVCLVLAVFFWFFSNIPTVIGDLSGRTARKSIAKMRAANEKSGVKAYKESKTNAARGKVTGSMSVKTGKPQTVPISASGGQPETGLLAENKSEELNTQVTQLLDEATTILGNEATGLLVDENATMPLAPTATKQPVRVGGKKIDILEEIMFIHTTEVI